MVIPIERRPLYSNFGIVPHEPALVAGMIDIIAFVTELSRIA